MENEGIGKIDGFLGIYTKLINGGVVNKTEEANNYNVNGRCVQRNIDDITEVSRHFIEINL